MKKLALLSIIAALIFSSVAILTRVQASNPKALPLAASRQEENQAVACSNETLEGVYGLSITGTRPAPPPPSGTPNYVPGTIEQVIGVGTRTFDGDGNFSQVTNEKVPSAASFSPTAPSKALTPSIPIVRERRHSTFRGFPFPSCTTSSL